MTSSPTTLTAMLERGAGAGPERTLPVNASYTDPWQGQWN